MPDPTNTCDLCGGRIAPHAHYIVRIVAFADPSFPAMTTEQIEELHTESEIDHLLEQMQHLSADELQDQVHRAFEFRLCPSCHKRFLANPLGLPRFRQQGAN